MYRWQVLVNQFRGLQQGRPAVRTVHQQQAGSGLDEVLLIWCGHIDSLRVLGLGGAASTCTAEGHLDEAAGTAEGEATAAAQPGAAQVKADNTTEEQAAEVEAASTKKANQGNGERKD